MARSVGRSTMGRVLVTGGCGFFGYHLVRQLLLDEDCAGVWVLDQNITTNRHEGATYLQGSVSDPEAVQSAIAKSTAQVIFHAASPVATLPRHRETEYTDTNIKGTEIVLTAADESECVCAVVYTSTMDVYANPPFKDIDETYPLWPADDRSREYNRTKAIGDRLVLNANRRTGLQTACIRPAHMYGERHIQGMVEVLDAATGIWPLVQIGAGDNFIEVVSGTNTATLHILVAKALLDPSRASGRVDGEAFNATDGAPVLFWHHIGIIYKEVRGEDALRKVLVIPGWLMLTIVALVEWLLWIFTVNTVAPPTMLRRLSIDYCIHTHTCSGQKAIERLHFKPIQDHDALVAESAKWMIRQRVEAKQLR